MKPDKRTCTNCGKDISDRSARAKFCSDKCTKAFKRNSDIKSDKTNSDTELGQDNSDNANLRDQLNKTDRTFYDRAIKDFGEPYYNFELDNVRDGKCAYCEAKFKTTLALNRYCSYEHYSNGLTVIVR